MMTQGAIVGGMSRNDTLIRFLTNIQIQLLDFEELKSNSHVN